ncbi:MAG: HD domain-containing phosphohydrolase [Planctomycetota bacterium]
MSTDSTSPARAQENEQHIESFFRVPVASLTPGTLIGFSLFAEVAGELIAFVAAGQSFQRHHRLTLLDAGQGDAYVPVHDRERYFQYLENNIAELLKFDGPVGEEQLSKVYDVGEVVTRELIEDPGEPQTRRLATSWVSQSAALFGPSQDDSVLGNMVRVLDVAPDLYQHSMHVCLYGLALARELGSAESEELSDFGIGLLLHDVGKLAIPGCLEATGSLDDASRERIQQHPQLGYDRVQGLNWVGAIARDVILHHHERPDGRGYPGGLRPADLTIHAKIAAVANAFDARTTERPYRPASPSIQVLGGMIDEGRGAFDAKILATFVRMLSA